MSHCPVFAASVAAALLTTLSAAAMPKTSIVYLASQNPERMGILRADFDSATGTLSAPTLAIETRDPAHFTLSADGRHLYMCNTGTPGGISAFAVDRASGGLTPLNYLESKGRGPSYVSVDRSGKFVLDANYGGGFVEVLSLKPDGSLAARVALIDHTGSSVHPQRQTKPYAHWIRTDPSNRFALAADLGTDQIVVYRFDAATGALTPNNPPAAKMPPGSGPRHLAFHPNGKWLYAVQEISNQVVALQWDTQAGTLTPFQTVSTLAVEFQAPNTAAEIAVRADGQFLYVSNRGEDSLAVFAIDAKSGELRLRQRIPSGGKVPRYFSFDPTGRWLLVANQESGNVVVFGVDAGTGELRQHGKVALPRPMGVVFAH